MNSTLTESKAEHWKTRRRNTNAAVLVESNPLKRSAELRDLSEEHHYGLVAARRLRLAVENGQSLQSAVSEFLAEWSTQIQPHFRSEEEILLPHFAAAASAGHELILRTLAEHLQLRVLVFQLTEAGEVEQPRLAAKIAQLLHDHIRFEERILFPSLEACLKGERLQRLGSALKHSTDEQITSRTSCRVLSRLSTG